MKAIVLSIYAVVFVVCAIHPYDRGVWWAENLPIVLLVAAVWWVSRRYEFSGLSWCLMLVLPVLHTIGGHYTFERVPFGWVTDLFGLERNHYDRIAHFSVGFYAYAIAEFTEGREIIRRRAFALMFAVFSIFTVAAVYEIFEWLYALSADPEAGIAVLGSQGDIWDAQKDMLADGLGALFAAALYALVYRHKSPGQTSAKDLAEP